MGQILTRREILVEALRELKNHKLVRDRFERLIEICMNNAGIAEPDYETFEQSVLYLAGRRFKESLIKTLAYRLAGNVDRLRHKLITPPWRRQQVAEWVPVQAVAVHRVAHDRWGVAARITLKILAGTPCPMTARVRWSFKRCRYVASELGFRQYGKKKDDPAPFPYARPEELTTMRWEMLVDPDLSEGDPYLTEVRYKPALQDWNKAQLRRRMRIDFTCMAGHPLGFPCSQCAVGYVNCPAATHRENWLIKGCRECQRPGQFWDLDQCRDSCIECYMRSLHKRR